MGSETKMTIYAYKDESYQSKKDKSFTVMFNPAAYTRKFSISYEEKQASGTTGKSQKLDRLKPGDLQLDFVIDGTGTVASIDVSKAKAAEIAKSDVPKVEVVTKVKEFYEVAIEMDGDKHRPSFLRVVWGDVSIDCVLSSCDVKYTLFDKQGKPIRATISATFKEAISDEVRVRKENKSSPDLTHVRIVSEGDTLPLMTYRIYGDSKYYLQVAHANGLKDFRNLKVGQEIFFPPIDKRAKT